MLFQNITILNKDFEAKGPFWVGIRNDSIAYIGKKEPVDKEQFGPVYDGTDKLLMPGFFNVHAHTAMTLLRGYGEGVPLQEWLFQKVFPFEDQWDDKAVYYSALMGLAESARAGIVSTSDMYFWCDNTAQAVVDSKSKMNLARSLSATSGYSFEEDPRWLDAQKVFQRWNNAADGRIRIDLSAHAEYTTNEAMLRGLAEAAKELSLRMQVHLSETAQEHENCLEETHRTPAQYMADCGIFDVPTIAAHCVWCDHNDIRLLARKGVTVATCPVSNMKLASGIADLPYMLKQGVKVAVGTDGVSSNNSLNFFEEMKMLSLLHKVNSKDPTFLAPKDVLYMATRAGALAQGRTDSGLVQEGMKADLIVIDLDQPNMIPCYDVLYNLVYSCDSGNIVMTMVDGNVLYENGEYKTIDMEKTIAETKKQAKRMLKKVANA